MADENIKDNEDLRTAQKRADFKKYLYAYIIINAIIWAVWWFTEGRATGFVEYPWPVWIMVGWGIGMVIKYLEAYHVAKQTFPQQEEEKMEN